MIDALIDRAAQPIHTELDEDRLRPSDVPVSIGDASRLRDAIGFEPARSLDETLDDILADARARVSNAG